MLKIRNQKAALKELAFHDSSIIDIKENKNMRLEEIISQEGKMPSRQRESQIPVFRKIRQQNHDLFQALADYDNGKLDMD